MQEGKEPSRTAILYHEFPSIPTSTTLLRGKTLHSHDVPTPTHTDPHCAVVCRTMPSSQPFNPPFLSLPLAQCPQQPRTPCLHNAQLPLSISSPWIFPSPALLCQTQLLSKQKDSQVFVHCAFHFHRIASGITHQRNTRLTHRSIDISIGISISISISNTIHTEKRRRDSRAGA